MCGIVGYVGPRDATEFLLVGLHRLEYRGYDSSGVAAITPGGEFAVVKTAGRIDRLEALLAANPDLPATSGSATPVGLPTVPPAMSMPTPIWAETARWPWSITASSRTFTPSSNASRARDTSFNRPPIPR